ncbi:MAG TPA: hypothetical protein VHE32_04460 [Rhodanobacteraceae bacterium]|nr:hypothetical protein [Rhodanobacteraceae bacterium]
MSETNRLHADAVRISLGLRALVSAFLLLAFGAASAVSFDYADSPVGRYDFAPGHFLPDANGAWAVGNAFASPIVRYRADGSVASVTSNPYGNQMLAKTIDGDLVLATPTPLDSNISTCTVSRRSSTGVLQWKQDVDFEGSCDSLASDSGGTLWIATRAGIASDPISVFRIGGDGAGFAGPLALPANFVALMLTPARAEGSYVAGYDSAASHPSIVALDAKGAVRWQYTDASGNGAFTQVGIDATGYVRTIGRAADGSLVVAAIDNTDGHALAQARSPVVGADRTSSFAMAADGSMFTDVPLADDSGRMLQKIDPAVSSVGWTSIPVPGRGSYSSEIDGHAGLRIAPNGDVLVLADSGNGSTPATRLTLVRFDSTGNVLATTNIDAKAGAEAIYASSLAAMPDSSALVSVYSADTPSDLPQSGEFVHVDRTGAVIASPYATSDAMPARVDTVATAIDDGGTAYLLTDNVLDPVDPLSDTLFDSRVALSSVSPDGAQRWKVDADGYWQDAKLAIGQDRVCILGNFAAHGVLGFGTPVSVFGDTTETRVECHALASGAVSSTATLVPAGDQSVMIGGIAFAANGSLLAIYAPVDGGGSPIDGIQAATLDAAGQLVATQTIDSDASLVAACGDGGFALVANGDSINVTRVDPDASVAWNLAVSTLSAPAAGAQCLDDGSVALEGFLSGNVATKFGVTLLSPAGGVRWTTVLADGGAVSPMYGFNDATADASNLYVSSINGPDGVAGALPIKSTVSRIDLATGNVAWTDTFEAVTQDGVAIDPASGTPVWYAIDGSRITTRVLDPAIGAVEAIAHQSCGSATCDYERSIRNARIASDGTLRYALLGGDTPHVVAIGSIASPLPSIDVAQAALSGVWYAPYAGGQGFSIDFVPASGTIFMPWFTYAPATDSGDAGNDPAALNWYSLQGTASSGDDSATLTIYANTGGAFASGTTSAHAVGTATLRFSDCGHGQLDYEFDATGSAAAGSSGTVDIVRLTPQAHDCAATNGTGAVATTDPNDGFDTNQSGAWFDPAAGGQGIELSVTPSSGASAGLLFGAWFTFDPAGAADDPTTQRWFTLQTDLSSASGGAVVVPIYSTLGGSFDDAPGTTTVRVGQATLTMQGCTSATLAYQFDSTVMAGAYRGLSGTLHLAPLTACSAE